MFEFIQEALAPSTLCTLIVCPLERVVVTLCALENVFVVPYCTTTLSRGTLYFDKVRAEKTDTVYQLL